MKTNGRFKKGDHVKALVTAQGLVKGTVYKVLDVMIQSTLFGVFVYYRLDDGDGRWLTNGHLILGGL